MSLAVLGLVLAAGLYVPSLVFLGSEIFNNDYSVSFDDCSGFFDCTFGSIDDILDSVGDLVGDLTQFLTLTGIDAADADPTFLTLARFALGLVWLIIILGFIRGSNQS